MNDISWIIYASDILPNFQVLIVCLAILLVVVLVIRLFVVLPDASSAQTERVERLTKAKKLFWWYTPIIIIIFAVGALIPSKSTLLMIAASQASEKIVSSSQGQSLIQSLNDILKEKVKP